MAVVKRHGVAQVGQAHLFLVLKLANHFSVLSRNVQRVHRSVFAVIGRLHQVRCEFMRIQLRGGLLVIVDRLRLPIRPILVGKHFPHEDFVKVAELCVLLLSHQSVLRSDALALH